MRPTLDRRKQAVELSFEAAAGGRSAGIGERLETCDEPVEARMTVHAVPSGTVSLHTDRGTVYRETLPGSGSGTVRWRTDVTESAFVRVEVRHPDGQMAALTNPIILA